MAKLYIVSCLYYIDQAETAAKTPFARNPYLIHRYGADIRPWQITQQIQSDVNARIPVPKEKPWGPANANQTILISIHTANVLIYQSSSL